MGNPWQQLKSCSSRGGRKRRSLVKLWSRSRVNRPSKTENSLKLFSPAIVKKRRGLRRSCNLGRAKICQYDRQKTNLLPLLLLLSPATPLEVKHAPHKNKKPELFGFYFAEKRRLRLTGAPAVQSEIQRAWVVSKDASRGPLSGKLSSDSFGAVPWPGC